MTSTEDPARSAEKLLGSLFGTKEFSEFVKQLDERIRSSSVEAFQEGTFERMIAALERHGAFQDETFFAKLLAEKGKWFWPRWRIERLRHLYLPIPKHASRASRALFVGLAIVLMGAAVMVVVHFTTQEPLPVMVPPDPVEKKDSPPSVAAKAPAEVHVPSDPIENKEEPPPEPVALPCGRGTEDMALITLPSGPLYVEIGEVTGKCYFATDAAREEASRGVLQADGVGDCPANGPAAFADDHPVVCVIPEEAKRYCEARGRRLPSRREWIDAVRRGSGKIMEKPVVEFVGPNETLMNLCGSECSFKGLGKRAGSDDFPRTAPVRHFVVEGAQLFDMHGNVSEITTNGDKFLACGSSWASYSADSLDPDTCDDTRMEQFHIRHQAVGFRCVKDPPAGA